MRFSSPKRIAMTTVVVGGGVTLFLLLLFSAMSIMEVSDPTGRNVNALPTKTDRSQAGPSERPGNPVDEVGEEVLRSGKFTLTTGSDPDQGTESAKAKKSEGSEEGRDRGSWCRSEEGGEQFGALAEASVGAGGIPGAAW